MRKKNIGIAASGPSLTQKDCETLKENCQEIIAVNDTWRMVDADHLYAADFHWWNHHIADINCGFTGKRWSCEPYREGETNKSNWIRQDAEEWDVKLFRCLTDKKGLSTDPEYVHSGGNSGYQAVNLALHRGATRIILIGFDMCNHSGKSHYFGDHPKAFANGSKPERFIAAYRSIKPRDYGIEIFNCSRVTALDAFPRFNLEDCFGSKNNS